MEADPDAASASVQMLVREKTPGMGFFHQFSIYGKSTTGIMHAIDQEQLLGTVQHTIECTSFMPLGLSLPAIVGSYYLF